MFRHKWEDGRGELGVSTSMKLSMLTRCVPNCDVGLCAKMIEGIHDLLLLTATPPNAAADF